MNYCSRCIYFGDFSARFGWGLCMNIILRDAIVQLTGLTVPNFEITVEPSCSCGSFEEKKEEPDSP